MPPVPGTGVMLIFTVLPLAGVINSLVSGKIPQIWSFRRRNGASPGIRKKITNKSTPETG